MRRLGFTATALSLGAGLAALLILGVGLSAARAEAVEATTVSVPMATNIGAIGAAEITTTAIVGAGETHTCALTPDGSLKCWGNNGNGRLGDNSTDERHTPVDVYGLSSGVKAVDGGYYHTCAVMTNGGVKCWGYNDKGQLGDGTTNQSLTPVNVMNDDDTLLSNAIAVSTGYEHSCALTSDGHVKCWGYNGTGCLGDNSTTNRYKAVVVTTTGGSPLTGIKAMEVGDWHSCAVTTGGGVKCWGLNAKGQLGNGESGGGTNRKTPVDVTGLSSGVATVSGGYDHTCGVLINGTAKCWGGHAHGQLGDGTVQTYYSTPRTVSGLSNAAAIAAGREHTCALLSTGAAKCWGYNLYGQLGDNKASGGTSNVPVDVSGIGSGSTAAAIAVGNYHSCAAFTGSGIKCWGYNSNGQLGDDSTDNRNTPVNVDGLGDYEIEGSVFGCAGSG